MNGFWKILIASALAISLAACAAAPSGTVSGEQLSRRIEQGNANLVILDVRTPEEFAAGHVPGARNIPHDQLPERIAELADAKNRDVIVYCRSGKRAAIAQNTLEAHGFKRIVHLEGDMLKWQEEGRAIER
jgi:phage shock protein E